MFRQLPLTAQARFEADRDHLRQRVLERLVDDQIVIFGVMRDLVVRLLHARGDHFVAVLAAGTQAPFAFVDRRRQDENANRLRPFALDLARALPIDVPADIVAGLATRPRFGKPGATAPTTPTSMV